MVGRDIDGVMIRVGGRVMSEAEQQKSSMVRTASGAGSAVKDGEGEGAYSTITNGRLAIGDGVKQRNSVAEPKFRVALPSFNGRLHVSGQCFNQLSLLRGI